MNFNIIKKDCIIGLQYKTQAEVNILFIYVIYNFLILLKLYFIQLLIIIKIKKKKIFFI